MAQIGSADPNRLLGEPEEISADSSTSFPELLTPQQVAGLLHIEASLLRRWRYERRGPTSFKVGKYVRYRLKDVRAWIDQQCAVSGQGWRP
jgi:hypothetical protein